MASLTREGSLRPVSRLSDLGRARMIGRTGVLALAVSSLAVLVYNLGVQDLPGPLDARMAQLWVLFLVFAVAELYVADARDRSELVALSPHEAGLVLGLFMLSPNELLLAQLAGATVALARSQLRSAPAQPDHPPHRHAGARHLPGARRLPRDTQRRRSHRSARMGGGDRRSLVGRRHEPRGRLPESAARSSRRAHRRDCRDHRRSGARELEHRACSCRAGAELRRRDDPPHRPVRSVCRDPARLRIGAGASQAPADAVRVDARRAADERARRGGRRAPRHDETARSRGPRPPGALPAKRIRDARGVDDNGTPRRAQAGDALAGREPRRVRGGRVRDGSACRPKRACQRRPSRTCSRSSGSAR